MFPPTCSSVGCWPSFMDVDGVDILRAPDDATGALATRRDMKVDVACVVTPEDVLVAHVDAGDTTNPSAVKARARKAATAIDFMFAGVARRITEICCAKQRMQALMRRTSLRVGMFR